MALRAVISKSDLEKLPEVLREHYAATNDADRFVLDADVDEHPKVGGLRNAVKTEREAARNAQAQFNQLKDQIGDLDFEQARNAVATVQQLQDKKLLDEGKVEELIKARTDAMAKAHQTELKAKDAKIEELLGKTKGLDDEVTTLVLDGTLRDEALRAGVKEEHLDDALFRLKVKGVEGVRWTLGDGRKVLAMQGEEVKFGKDAEPMSPSEGLDMLKKVAPAFFKPTTGGGASNNSRLSPQNYASITDVEAKDLGKYKAAKESAAAAGQELRIVQTH
jgi:hypothetical protein